MKFGIIFSLSSILERLAIFERIFQPKTERYINLFFGKIVETIQLLIYYKNLVNKLCIYIKI